MRLSKRIYALADAVNQGDTVADIGTDHGYVPMLLVRDGKSPRVIMAEISVGSLAKAKETFELSRLSDKVCDADFRIGDGLGTIAAGETDEIIIAGLGGHTIVQILDADPDKSRSFMQLVLQPRKHSGTLRYYLYTHGWDIEKEILAEEGKFACEIITAVPSGKTFREPPYEEDDIRWKYPESLEKADHSLARKRVEWKMSSIKEELENLKSSAANHERLIGKLKADLDYLSLLNSHFQ